MKKSLILIFSMVFLVTCASTRSHDKLRFSMYDEYIIENKLLLLKKVRTFKFLNWKSLDNKHLIVSSNQKKQYLVTLQHFCIDLDLSHTIGIDQTMNSSLSANFDSVVVSGQPHQKCRIETIHELNQEQEKEVMALRKKLLQANKEK